MTYSYEIFKRAKNLGSIIGNCDYSLVVTLGSSDFGWTLGDDSEKFLGTALDVTGATVKLHLYLIPDRISTVGIAAGYNQADADKIGTITGTLTDASNGVVTFSIPKGHLGGHGVLIGEIVVTESDDDVICPGHFRLTLIRRLSAESIINV